MINVRKQLYKAILTVITYETAIIAPILFFIFSSMQKQNRCNIDDFFDLVGTKKYFNIHAIIHPFMLVVNLTLKNF